MNGHLAMLHVSNVAQSKKGNRVKFVLQPWQVMLLIFAGWINQQQQEVIDLMASRLR